MCRRGRVHHAAGGERALRLVRALARIGRRVLHLPPPFRSDRCIAVCACPLANGGWRPQPNYFFAGIPTAFLRSLVLRGASRPLFGRLPIRMGMRSMRGATRTRQRGMNRGVRNVRSGEEQTREHLILLDGTRALITQPLPDRFTPRSGQCPPFRSGHCWRRVTFCPVTRPSSRSIAEMHRT